MKKRILFSYVIAFSLLLANISFAGYTTPVQEFFVDDGQVTSLEPMITHSEENSVQHVSSPSHTVVLKTKEIFHEDTIELFEYTTSREDNDQDVWVPEKQELDDFVNALEQELAL